MNESAPSRLLDRIVIRVPDGMRARIAAAAKANNRSVNAELVALLEDTYPLPADIENLKFTINLLIGLTGKAEDPAIREQIRKQLAKLHSNLVLSDAGVMAEQANIEDREFEAYVRSKFLPKRDKKPAS